MNVMQIGGVKGDQRIVEENTFFVKDVKDPEVLLFLVSIPEKSYELDGRRYVVAGKDAYTILQPVTGILGKDGDRLSWLQPQRLESIEAGDSHGDAFAKIKTMKQMQESIAAAK